MATKKELREQLSAAGIGIPEDASKAEMVALLTPPKPAKLELRRYEVRLGMIGPVIVEARGTNDAFREFCRIAGVNKSKNDPVIHLLP